MRSASGAMPAGPPAWPFPAAMSRTWVPCAPRPARSAIAGWYPSRSYGRGSCSARSISSRSWTVAVPVRIRARAQPPGPADPRTTGTGCPPLRGRRRLPPGRRATGTRPSPRPRPSRRQPPPRPRPVSASAGLRRTSVGALARRAGRARSGEPAAGSNPGLRPRAALTLMTSRRARTAMTSRARIRQVAIVPKRETIRTPGISISGRASRMIASSTRSPSAPASARSNSHRAGSTAHSSLNHAAAGLSLTTGCRVNPIRAGP